MVLGPGIGSFVFSFGGFATPFFGCGGVFVVSASLVYFLIPQSVETEEDKTEFKSKITYWDLMKNRRVATSALASGVCFFQFVFVEPFLPIFLFEEFDV